MGPSTKTNESTKQSKTSTSKDHRRSQRNKEHSTRKTIDKSEKSKRMQSKISSSHKIKQLSLEIKNVENEIQKKKRELIIKDMLIQKLQQSINQAKKHKHTDKVENNTLRANNVAGIKSSKSSFTKSKNTVIESNDNKETEGQFCDRNDKLQKKRKREKNSQNQPVEHKIFKNIECIINISEDSNRSSDSEKNEIEFGKESSPDVDCSFLDEINVDEIVAILNATETENKGLLDQSVSFKDNINQSGNNKNNDPNTSINLQVPEIKSAAGFQIKEQTTQEHIDEQPNTRHEIKLSEQINAKCRNDTSPYRENPALKNDAGVHMNVAVQKIQEAEKDLPTHDKNNCDTLAKQYCPINLKSIFPNRKLTSGINDEPLVKNMTERIFEYIHIKYTAASLIHNGKFSQIFKCKDSMGNVIAAKISKEDDTTTGYEREQMLLKVQDGIPKEKLSCVYLINGLAVESKWCYLLEYYSKNLQQALNEYGKSFHVDTLLSFAHQLVSAVFILRKNNIVHSDIKPSHILIDSNNKQLKLCGFDTACYLEHMQLTSVVGTSNYRSPEAILGYTKGHSVDLWATALVLHEMATNQKLFHGSTNNEVLYQQMCIFGKVPWLMLERSEFKDTYFRGNCFLRQKPYFQKVKSKFSRRAKVSASIFEAYNRDWFYSCNAAQRREDITRLHTLCNILNQMLVLDPDHRLPIEFVYAHPLIYWKK